ncbi:hypothetical protein WN944_009283 [Citrus x changshan-huyou]|uniref:Uncharacterized protein n=1 Tax=Citrus x changshan-huyou TaxID=2935761 RepID=A0AAP0QZP3_9ROSI
MVSGMMDQSSGEGARRGHAAATGVIDEQMAKLEELKKQTRQLISTYHPEKSRTEAALVSDALELILKNAGVGLF